MSNFTQVAWNPKERVARAAAYMDNHFGHHEYGVRFEGDPHVYRPAEVEIPIDLVLVPEIKDLVQSSSQQAESLSGHPNIRIDSIGGNCPVQATGLIDGEPFYFRARGDEWSLRIGSYVEDASSIGVHGRDVVGNPRWQHEEEWGDAPYDAGWMPPEVAVCMIKKAAEIFRASAPRQIEEAQRADTGSPVAQHLPDTKITGSQ